MAWRFKYLVLAATVCGIVLIRMHSHSSGPGVKKLKHYHSDLSSSPNKDENQPTTRANTGDSCCAQPPKPGHFISGMKLRNFAYLKNEGVFACFIPKAGSTFLKNLLASYAGRVNSPCQVDIRVGLNKSLVWACQHLNESHFGDFYSSAKHKMVVVRDPIDRFLSAYLWVCIINYEVCKDYAHPAKRLQGNGFPTFRVTQMIDKLHEELLERTDDFQDSFFVRYVWEHFAPAHLFCGFSGQNTDYKIISMGANHEKRVLESLETFGLNKDALAKANEDNKAKLEVPKTPSTRKKELVDEIAANPEAAVKLLNIYAKDYEMFDYQVPSWLCNAAQSAKCHSCMKLCNWLNSQSVYRFE